MDKLLKIAFAQLGEKEIQGEEDNPTIVNYAKQAGFDWVDDDETPWCSIFVNWVAMRAGLLRSKSAMARSWEKVGRVVDEEPEPGDIVIFYRDSLASGKGHVGFYLGTSKDAARVYCLGGNQGNQVSVSAYPIERVTGYRRLAEAGIMSLPDPALKRGDTGDRVKKLQDALKAAGFNCGTSDGDFGPKTEDALKQFQESIAHLDASGIYDQGSKDALFDRLNA